MFRLPRGTGQWLYGLVSTVIQSAAGATAVILVDPKDFNLNEGLPNLFKVAAALAIVAAFGYLQKKPLPDWDGTDRRSPTSVNIRIPPEFRE